jgi:hypothetical protein
MGGVARRVFMNAMLPYRHQSFTSRQDRHQTIGRRSAASQSHADSWYLVNAVLRHLHTSNSTSSHCTLCERSLRHNSACEAMQCEFRSACLSLRSISPATQGHGNENFLRMELPRLRGASRHERSSPGDQPWTRYSQNASFLRPILTDSVLGIAWVTLHLHRYGRRTCGLEFKEEPWERRVLLVGKSRVLCFEKQAYCSSCPPSPNRSCRVVRRAQSTDHMMSVLRTVSRAWLSFVSLATLAKQQRSWLFGG